MNISTIDDCKIFLVQEICPMVDMTNIDSNKIYKVPFKLQEICLFLCDRCPIDLSNNIIKYLCRITSVEGETEYLVRQITPVSEDLQESSCTYKIGRVKRYDIVRKLNKPEYVGIKLDESVIKSVHKDRCRVLKDIVKYIVTYPSFRVYGEVAAAIYTNKMDNDMMFNKIKFSHNKDFSEGSIKKIYNYLVGKEYDSSKPAGRLNKAIIDTIKVTQEEKNICLNLSVKYVCETQYNLQLRSDNIVLEFSYKNLEDLYPKMLDCNCIAWDGKNFYVNSRFHKLKSIILEEGMVYDIDEIKECLHNGYTILAKNIDFTRLQKNSVGLENILYKAIYN